MARPVELVTLGNGLVMRRLTILLLFVACANPTIPTSWVVSVVVDARDTTVSGVPGCVGTFTITTRAGPELTFMSVAALSQDNSIWTTTVRHFAPAFVVDGGFQPTIAGIPNAARFSYHGRVPLPNPFEIPVQFIEAPCGTSVRREHQ